MSKLLLISALMVWLPASATAATIEPAVPTAVAGGYLYTFTINLGNYAVMNAGEQAAIYDLGPVNDITVPVGWAFSQTTTGPSLGGFVTDTSVPNLVLHYTGANPIGPGVVSGFSFVSASGTYHFVDYAVDSSGLTGGIFADAGVTIAPDAVPEPGTIAMFLGSGLILLGSLKLPRRA